MVRSSITLSLSNCVRLAISLLHNSKKCLFLNVILLYWIAGTVYVVGLKGMLIARWDVLDGVRNGYAFKKFVGCTHVL